MDMADSFGFLNAADLALSAACGLSLGYGAALISGFFPLGAGAFPERTLFGRVLVLAVSGELLLVALLLLGFIFMATAWAPAVIAAALALLAGPLLFQAFPTALSASVPGLLVLLLLVTALAFLLFMQLFG